MKIKSRNAFTMIELLIVIAIITILAGGLMIYGEETMASAKANNVITNMKIIKTAALEWIADYSDYIEPYTYVVTYPLPYITAKDLRNKIEKDIQNVMRSDEHGRATMMKYIQTSENISVNEATSKPYTQIDGYAIIDISGGHGTGLGESFKYDKWYVVYKPDSQNKNVKKMLQKIEGRARTEGLYKNATEYYTADASPNYVYMEIIDFKKR